MKRRFIKVKRGVKNLTKTTSQTRKEVTREINEVLKTLKFDFSC